MQEKTHVGGTLYVKFRVQKEERKGILRGDLIHWRLTAFSLMTIQKFLTTLFEKNERKKIEKDTNSSYMNAHHIQTENMSFSSVVFHKTLHRSVFQMQVLSTCLNENHHKEYQGRKTKGSLGTPHHQPACRRMVQTKLSWEGLTSSVKCVWWLRESSSTVSAPLSTMEKLCAC